MKREEAQALIRKQKMSCKGPWKPVTKELVDKAYAMVQDKLPTLEVIKALPVATTLKDDDTRTIQPLVVLAVHSNEGDLARALERLGRQRCGYDFSITIANGPLDGSAQSYKCPQCGLEGHYTAPVFDIEG